MAKAATERDAERRVKGVGSGAKVSDGAQIFQGMAFFLQWIIRSGDAFHHNFTGVDFTGLFGVGRQRQRAVTRRAVPTLHLAISLKFGTLASSKTTCRLEKELPSFNSIKPSALESRMVLTHPHTVICWAGQCAGLFQYFFQFRSCHEKNLRLTKIGKFLHPAAVQIDQDAVRNIMGNTYSLYYSIFYPG